MGYEENIEDRLFESIYSKNESLKQEIASLKQEVKDLQSLIVRLENAVRSQLPRRQW